MSTPIDQQPPPPPPFLEATQQQQQQQENYHTGHGSVGPVIAVLFVITFLGVIAGMIGRLCTGRGIFGRGEYDFEGWVERKCSSCIDGHVDPLPMRRIQVPGPESVEEEQPEEEEEGAPRQEKEEEEEQQSQQQQEQQPQQPQQQKRPHESTSSG